MTGCYIKHSKFTFLENKDYKDMLEYQSVVKHSFSM